MGHGFLAGLYHNSGQSLLYFQLYPSLSRSAASSDVKLSPVIVSDRAPKALAGLDPNLGLGCPVASSNALAVSSSGC